MKLYYSDEYMDGFCISHNNTLCFDIEKDKWEYTKTLKDSEIIPLQIRILEKELEYQYEKLISLGYSDQYLMFMDIFHMDENISFFPYEFTKTFYANRKINKILFVHTNKNYHKEIYYDSLYNRQKAFFIDYENIGKGGRVNTYNVTKECYMLDDIKHTSIDKVFLCPNRLYNWDHYRFKYRKMLRDHILSLQKMKGYISDPPQNILEPQQTNLLHKMKTSDYGGGGTWYPIHNKYYQETYISIYIETIVVNNDDVSFKLYDYRGVTEKTFDPLIKGHFILPFGYSGLIQDIKDYGFELPDFIDYSYDTIKNNDDRFLSFLESINKLENITLEQWQTLYVQNYNMLINNRQLFYTKPYDSLYHKVLAKTKNNKYII